MGSFIGHLDIGVVLLVLGVWWTVNMFRDYRKSMRSGQPFRSRISYTTTIRKRRVPLEIYLKIIFPFIALLAEIFSHNPSFRFVDERNRFKRINNLQHITYFALFIIHGITDLLSYYKVSAITKELKYFTASIAWYWLGVEIYFHIQKSMHRPPLENMLHRLNLPPYFIIASLTLWEKEQREIIMPQLLRCIAMVYLGIWSIQLPFILYKPFGRGPNPAWNQTEMQNVDFLSALYGYDIIFGIIVVTLIYAALAIHENIAGYVKSAHGRKGSKGSHEYHQLNGVEVNKKESYKQPANFEAYHDEPKEETSID